MNIHFWGLNTRIGRIDLDKHPDVIKLATDGYPILTEQGRAILADIGMEAFWQRYNEPGPPLTLLDYRQLYRINKCRWDGAPLAETIDTYDHPDGLPVAGFTKKQWLSRKCTKCGYDWSLWKLGVAR